MSAARGIARLAAALLLGTGASVAWAADYNVLIRGGTVVDGTGAPRRTADVAIKDGRIAAIYIIRNPEKLAAIQARLPAA